MARVHSKVKVCVISLQASFDRRASIEAQLAPFGVDYTFFRAVEGPRGYQHFEEYDERAYLINTGRVATAGEVGCYASHLCLWQQCARQNESIVIMEDDAHLKPGFPASLGEADKLIQKCGFIRLQSDRPQSNRPSRAKRKAILSTGAFTLYLFSHYPYGALCYAIAPRVARAFVECSRAFREPVDSFIKKPWIHGAPLFGLAPYPAFGRPFESTIGQRAKNKPTVSLRTSRALKKLSNLAHKTKFNLSVDSHLEVFAPANGADISKRI